MLNVQLQEILNGEYEYRDRKQLCRKEYRRYLQKIENALSAMDFSQRDEILSSVNALCAEYEYAAFMDGYQRGAKLILSFLCNDV